MLQFVVDHTDFVLGIKYLRCYPERLFQLSSGLTIYRSWLKNLDDTRGVIGDPRKSFREIESIYHINRTVFKSDQNKLFKAGYQVNPYASFLHFKIDKDCFNDFMSNIDKILEPSNKQLKVE